VGFPIAGLVEGDTVRFKGSWVEGVFVVDDEKGVCLEGTVNGLPVLYGDGRYAITLNIGDETDVGILLPLDFDTSKVPDGVFIRACGTWVDALPDYDFLYILDAYSIEVTPTEDVDVIEPGGRGGIYCDGGKDKPHPLAVKLSEQGVTEEWVMEQFCTGFGFGEIMLALRTHALLGEDTLWNTRAILSLRNEMGWGQIWKFLGLKNGDEESAPPPGPLSKPDQEDSQPPGWKNKPEKNKGLPPGWQKKQDKHDDLPPGLKKKNNQ
jgi:hypothetical protein